MITVIAEIKVRAGHLDAIVKRFQALQAEVLAEEGCYQYTPLTDTLPAIERQSLAADTLFMVERWESHAHLDAHLKRYTWFATMKKRRIRSNPLPCAS